MNLAEITPLILTFNEEANLRETLERLQWASQIVIIDSFSDDTTLAIIRDFPNAAVVQRHFDDHTSQWNFGLTQVQTDWTLAIDADYHCTTELEREITSLDAQQTAYSIGFHLAVFGKPLRSSIYPPRVSLFETNAFQYREDGHTQLLDIDSAPSVGSLNSCFIHDDRKSVNRWLRSQYKYADLELRKLIAKPANQLEWKDRIRTWIVVAPALTLIYCLFFKLLILDGWAGIYYTLQRVIAELILSLKLVDHRLRSFIGTDQSSKNQ